MQNFYSINYYALLRITQGSYIKNFCNLFDELLTFLYQLLCYIYTYNLHTSVIEYVLQTQAMFAYCMNESMYTFYQ